MSTEKWTDQELIEAITGTEEAREKALRHLFHEREWQKLVVNYIESRGGNPTDAEDLFQEAIIIFDRNLRQGKFKGESKLKTYFLSVAKHLWWRSLRKKRPQVELQPEHYDEATEGGEVNVIREERKRYFAEALGKIGERCKLILQLYQLDYSMEEIARAAALSSAAMAKKEAYRCRMRFRRFLEDNPGWAKLIN